MIHQWLLSLFVLSKYIFQLPQNKMGAQDIFEGLFKFLNSSFLYLFKTYGKHNTYNVVATIYFQKFSIPKIISFPHIRKKNTVHIVVISMSKIFFKSHRRAKD